jgi:hypothetical protein
MNRQQAPFPHDLEHIVGDLSYRPGWTFSLRDIVRDPATSHGAEASGLTFIVTTSGYDAYHPDRGESYRVNHYFPVPAATYNYLSWLRWVFDCLIKVETHECMEFFTVVGVDSRPLKPYAPTHGPGDDPYVVHEYATAAQRNTRYTGEMA